MFCKFMMDFRGNKGFNISIAAHTGMFVLYIHSMYIKYLCINTHTQIIYAFVQDNV